MSNLPIGIVGGGIVGLAIGRELARRHSGMQVVVFEKEPSLGSHQTGRNSGVVHAGIYYKPGSLKAELCTSGRLLLEEYCQEHEIPYDSCGKLVVAVDESELGRLDALERTATENGVPGLARLEGSALSQVEPHVTGVAALHSPMTAITDFTMVAESLGKDIVDSGGTIHLSTPVREVRAEADSVVVATTTASHRVSRLVVCAGLQSDRVSSAIDGHPEPRIVPFRGDYMSVLGDKRDLVRGLIYPVPDPRYPFLGVHFTRTVTGELEVGPNAVLALDREGYRRRFELSAEDVTSILGWPGFWRMAAANWRAGAVEVWDSLSMRSYMKKASRYVPSIGPEDVVRSRHGIRAQGVDRDGSLVDDFRIFESNGVVTVRNAPSPAATSSLAIAEWVVDRFGDWA